jgi:hypothetical protein
LHDPRADRFSDRLHIAVRDGSLDARQPNTCHQLVSTKRLSAAVALDDGRFQIGHPFVRGESLTATEAFAASANRILGSA